MTTEDDFQAALDLNPNDWQTRLVFADWLQDHDDPRAEGYRILGTRRWCPEDWMPNNPSSWTWWDKSHIDPTGPFAPGLLPTDCLKAIEPQEGHLYCRDYSTRREAEDAAALGFLNLPPARRAELLAMEPR